MVDRSLRCVVLDRVYDMWGDPVAQGLFRDLVDLKRAGFGAEYGYGVLPLDTHDFASAHFAIVDERDGGLMPLMAARITTLDRARLFNIAFPALQLCALAAAQHHGRAVQQLIDRCAADGRKLSYWDLWTIHPEARADHRLSVFLVRCLGGIGHLLARECGVTDQVMGATLRSKVDQTARAWGFEPMLLDGAPLPPLEIAQLLGEPVQLMQQARPSEAALKLADEMSAMWDNRLVLAPGGRVSDEPPAGAGLGPGAGAAPLGVSARSSRDELAGEAVDSAPPAPARRDDPARVSDEGRILAGGNLLDKLSRDDRARLFALGRPRVVAEGEEVVRQGSVGDCLFVVEDGELAVVRSLPGDEEKVLVTARPGMLLGELAVLDGGARAASLRAVRRSVLRVIELGAFEALTLHGGDAGHRILRAVAALVHERLNTTRRVAAAHVAPPRVPPRAGANLDWSSPGLEVVGVLGALPAFAGIHGSDREAMMPGLGIAAVERGADVVLPEADGPGVVMVLRGALSPWLDDGSGPEVTMPAVGPGGFVDYAAALGFASETRRWRVRSPTRLMRLDAALFDPGAASSARLLYALSRDLATTLRRTTGLAMHFGMAWARQPERRAPRHRQSPERPHHVPAHD